MGAPQAAAAAAAAAASTPRRLAPRRLNETVFLALSLLVVILPHATRAFVLPPAAPVSRGLGSAGELPMRMSSSSDSSSDSSDSDRRSALGRLVLGGLAAAAASTISMPPPAAMAAGAATPASKKPALAPYPAKVTDKAYLDVRITGFVTGEEKATNEEYSGRLVLGLFGADAPLAVEAFKQYAAVPYGGDAPSYAFSAFVRADPGVAVTAGRIKGLKEILLAGTKEYEWFDRVLGAKGLDEPKLRHDRKGLLTKSNDAVDPVFDITLSAAPERDGRATVFGVVLEGMDVLSEIASVPVYTMEAAGPQPEGLDKVFVEQKKLFLNVARKFGDERAVDRRGSFLKRVEVVGCGLL